jgi:hypothetical protein
VKILYTCCHEFLIAASLNMYEWGYSFLNLLEMRGPRQKSFGDPEEAVMNLLRILSDGSWWMVRWVN